jgi:hypothetical protein
MAVLLLLFFEWLFNTNALPQTAAKKTIRFGVGARKNEATPNTTYSPRLGTFKYYDLLNITK